MAEMASFATISQTGLNFKLLSFKFVSGATIDAAEAADDGDNEEDDADDDEDDDDADIFEFSFGFRLTFSLTFMMISFGLLLIIW